MAASSPAVISVIGHDQKGVVARISTYLAQHSVNIENIEQRVMEGLFIMTMLVDLADISVSLDRLILDLKEMGKGLQMDVTVRLHGEKTRKRLALLVSKEPHCLDAILRDYADGEIEADIAGVFSNHPDLETLATEHGLEFVYASSSDKAEHMRALHEQMRKWQPDLIVLARYMQVLTPDIVQSFRSRILNIHPSLLPYYPGANAYKQAYEAGVRVCGCTAHIVTEDLDEGPIVLQDVFHIDVGSDTLEIVKQRGRELEAEVLSKAVRMFVREELVVTDNKVLFRPGRLS
jgi:formyltetrahydrofolate deformylase